jgi:hypothetical protein
METINKIFDYVRVAMWAGAAILLSLPWLAMRFFPEAGVNWTGSDFIVMGALLLIVCGTVEFGARMSENLLYRVGVIVAVGTGFLTVWVNLAVGMILSEGNPENLVFLGVLAIALIGAFVVRFSARGMARVMLAAGIAQALIAAVVAVVKLDDLYTATLIGLFALPWLLSAGLFHLAAEKWEFVRARPG